MQNNRQQNGFTLLEIITVIIIIGIIGTIITPKIFLSINASKDTAIKAILASTRSDIDSFITKKFLENGIEENVSFATLNNDNTVIQGILANPYNKLKQIRNANGEYHSLNPSVIDSHIFGWAYDQSNGKLWANTNYNNENQL